MVVAELTDEALVARCQAGDPDAWNELVERFGRYVLAICMRAFRLSHEDAEDVFQDVFAKAYTELQRLRDPSALRPWLAQLTRRACIDRLRRDRSSADELPDVEDPSETLVELERALDVHEAMRTLGDACNEILDRFFARDESYRTIAEELDLAPGTIASRISRCLGKLRAAMEDSPAPARQVDR